MLKILTLNQKIISNMKYLLSVALSGLLLLHTVTATGQQTLPEITPFVAPDFSLQGEDGSTYTLSEMRGKVIVMNFWATWCPPCREEMPSMERLWSKVKNKNITVLGINVGEDADTIFEFNGQYPVSFPIPMDIDGKVIENYPVRGLPTTYIINPEGMATHRAVGSREWDDENMIKLLLGMRK